MNFVEIYNQGKAGMSKGLPTGIEKLDIAMNGTQRKAIIAVAAAPKVGKTTLVDYSFVLSPYLYSLENPEVEIDWIYWSFEIDRVKKEFKYAAFFFYKDYGISNFNYNGKLYPITSNYLMGKLTDERTGQQIPVSGDHENKLKQIYTNRIIPLFGEYDIYGKQVRKGKIDFIEQRDNPTGLRNYLITYAKNNGEFVYQTYYVLNQKNEKEKRERVIGYKPNNPKKQVIIITDHIRKLNRERGFTLKENIDKWIEYQVELRNWCGYTFIDICHLNRNMADIERIKYMKDAIYPNGDDIKDTGNLSEEADYVLTMFNANDDKYNLKSHFGLPLIDDNGSQLHPNYRSIHLVESRDTECPKHIQTNMFSGINNFGPIRISN